MFRVAVNFEPRSIPANRNCLRPARQWTARAALRRRRHRILGSSLPMSLQTHAQRHGHDRIQKSGQSGLNLAFIGHWRRTIRHSTIRKCSTAAACNSRARTRCLARSLGMRTSRSFEEAETPSTFSLPGISFVHYSSRLLWPLALLSVFCSSRNRLRHGACKRACSDSRQLLLTYRRASLAVAPSPLGLLSGVHWLYLHFYLKCL